MAVTASTGWPTSRRRGPPGARPADAGRQPALARIPGPGEFRGNLAKGGTGKGVVLSERDRWISAEVGPELRRRGILFAGLDVIGDYLTEINVTSPTCIRELDAQYGLNIAADLFNAMEQQHGKR